MANDGEVQGGRWCIESKIVSFKGSDKVTIFLVKKSGEKWTVVGG